MQDKKIIQQIIKLHNSGINNKQIVEQLESIGNHTSYNSVKAIIGRLKHGYYKNINIPKNSKDSETVASAGIKPNGIRYNIAILPLTKEDMQSDKTMLRKHGFNPDNWILVSVSNTVWQQHSTKDGTVDLYRSKIDVKPKIDKFTPDDLIKLLNKEIQPRKLPKHIFHEKTTNLVIPLADLHFGEMFFEDYEPYLQRMKEIISRGYNQIVIEQLGDLFDSDQINSEQTVKATVVGNGHNNMPKGVEDSDKFIVELIEFAYTHCNKLSMKYVGGNHDFDLSYMYQWGLTKRYPDVDIDLNNGYRNAYLLDNVGIILSHGDFSEKKIPNLFPIEFKDVYSKAKWAESHSGHLHYLKNVDENGLIFRQFPTPVKGNSWNYKMGLTMAHKFMELIEYYPDKPKEIYYI